MASFKALCLAGVASLVATATAHAADLPLPAPPPVYMPPPPVIGGNWYLRGDVGIGIADLNQKGSSFNPAVLPIPGLAYNDSSLDDTSFIDAGVGYRFNQYFRADVTGEYRAAAHFGAVESYTCKGSSNCRYNPRGEDAYNGSVKSEAGLVNGYVDAGTWYGVTPWAGAGVGLTHVTFGTVTDQGAEAASGGFGVAQAHDQTNFAFALMAGLDFAITRNLTLELGYRYLDQGRIATGTIVCQGTGTCANEVQHYHLASNDIRLGFRYTFADFAPIGPPPVLISKY